MTALQFLQVLEKYLWVKHKLYIHLKSKYKLDNVLLFESQINNDSWLELKIAYELTRMCKASISGASEGGA